MGSEATASCFISYAREDTAFVRKLDAALAAAGTQVWVDYDRLLAASDWRDSIRRGVESCDVFVSVLSPESIASDACGFELDCAVAANKRIVPVLVRSVEGLGVSGPLETNHWLLADGPQADVDAIGTQIREVLATDPEHVAEHTRLTLRAADWERAGRDRSQLLRGRELDTAERWVDGRAEPPPSNLHRAFIASSRKHASRRQRSLLGVLVVALIAVSSLALVAVHQRDDARRLGNESESRRLAGVAGQLVTRDVKLAERVALAAERRARTSEAEIALRQAVGSDEVRWTARLPGGIRAIAWRPPQPSGLAAAIAAAGARGGVTLLDPATGRPLERLPAAPTGVPRSIAWADGDRRVVVEGTRAPFVWDTSRPGAAPVRLARGYASVIVSANGARLLVVDRNGRMTLRDAHDDRVIARVATRQAYAPDVALSEDGSRIAYLEFLAQPDPRHFGNRVKTWIPRTGRRLTLRGRAEALLGYTRLAYARPHLTACSGDALLTWHRLRPRRAALGSGCSVIDRPQLSPSRRTLAVAEDDGVVDLLGYEGGFAHHLHPQRISTDVSLFAAVDVADPEFPSTGSLASGRLAVAGTDGSVWRYRDGAAKRRLAVLGAGVLALAWAPVGDALLVLDGHGRAWMWGARPHRWVPNETVALVLSNDERLVATAANGRVTLRETRTLRTIMTARSRGTPVAVVDRGHAVLMGSAAVFSEADPARTRGGVSTSLRIVDASHERRLPGRYDSYVVAGDGPMLVGTRHNHTVAMDLSDPHLARRRLPPLGGWIFMNLDPQGRRLVTLYEDSEPFYGVILDLRSGRRRRVPDALQAVFAPSGRQLAVVEANQRAVRVVDVETERVVRRFTGLSPVDDVSWSHDGQSLLAVGNTLHINGGAFVALHLSGPVDRTTFDEGGTHAGPRYSVDDRLVIATRSGNGSTVDVWDAGTGELISSWAHDDLGGTGAVIVPGGSGVLSLGTLPFGRSTLDLYPCSACGSLELAVAAAKRQSDGRKVTPEERARYRLAAADG